MNIPTKITVTRIAFVVALVLTLFICSFIPEVMSYQIPGTNILLLNLVAMIVFVLAASTDYLDGYLARKWNQVTNLGKFLDPIADKLLVDASLIYLAIPNPYLPDSLTISFFFVIVMIARDLVVDVIRQIAASEGKVVAANIFGKIKTVLQMIAIPFVFLNGWPFSYFDANWPSMCHITDILIYLATFASLLSGVIYVVQNRSILVSNKNKEEE